MPVFMKRLVYNMSVTSPEMLQLFDSHIFSNLHLDNYKILSKYVYISKSSAAVIECHWQTFHGFLSLNEQSSR